MGPGVRPGCGSPRGVIAPHEIRTAEEVCSQASLDSSSRATASVASLVVRSPRGMFVYGHIPNAAANSTIVVALVTPIDASSAPAHKRAARAACAI